MAQKESIVSFREHSAWAALLTTAVVYGIFVFGLARGWVGLGSTAATRWLVEAMVLQTIAVIAISIVATIRTRPEAKDERDRAIDLKAARAAYIVLGACVVMASIVLIWAPAATGSSLARPEPAVVGQLLLLGFVASELVRFGTQVLLYRRGV